MQLIDSHCHLDFPAFAPDLDAVLARAEAAGVVALVTIGTRLREADRVLALAERYPQVWCTVGVHPHYVDDEPLATAERLVALARHPKVVGIGETGLDTWLGQASWDAQVASLAAHIEAARETQLPLVIHSVRQDAAMAATLEREHARGAFPVVMHSFSGGAALARTCLDLGHALSFSGLLSYPEQAATRALVAGLPAEQLLVETDAPSLAPMPDPDARNEPARIGETVALLSGLRGLAPEEIARQTRANFRRIFARCTPP